MGSTRADETLLLAAAEGSEEAFAAFYRRWLPIVIGCAAFAVGLLLANPLITTHPDYPLLSLALALAGIGIGITVVPVTATVLNAVVPERSGMAASATNTSREIGAVTGVAVLGALVFSQLSSSLTANLQALNVPADEKLAILGYKSTIISFIETGQAPTNYESAGPIVGKVIQAAYASFGDGLHDALYLSAALVIVAGLLTAVTPDEAGRDAWVAEQTTALRQAAPGALRATTALLRTLRGRSWSDALADAAATSAELFAGAEAAEGMDAFLQKRRPSWDTTT